MHITSKEMTGKAYKYNSFILVLEKETRMMVKVVVKMELKRQRSGVSSGCTVNVEQHL